MKKEVERIGLRIPYDLNTKLIERADALGITKNALVILILREWEESQLEQKREG